MTNANHDGLPVLTDVLIPGHVGVRARDVLAAVRSREGGQASGDWDALEREVRENVLRGLQARIDLVLEQRLKEKLSDLLEQVLSNMTSELKTSLRETMRDVVNRAVTQEIARVRATKVN
jgi:hypothetical protein